MRPSCPLPKLRHRHLLASESNGQAPAWRVVQSRTRKNRKAQMGSRTCSSYVFRLRNWTFHLRGRPTRFPSRAGLCIYPRPAQALTSMPVMSITVLVAADTACRVTITKLAAPFDVAGLGAELRAVEGCKQAASSHLPRDRGQRILRTGGAGGGVLRGIVHARACAAIGVAHHYAPRLVHSDVVEVQQVAARVAPALVPNAAALHGVGWCRVGGGPGPP